MRRAAVVILSFLTKIVYKVAIGFRSLRIGSAEDDLISRGRTMPRISENRPSDTLRFAWLALALCQISSGGLTAEIGAPAVEYNRAEIQSVLSANERPQSAPISALKQQLGRTAYVPLSYVRPGQVRVSYHNMIVKIDEAIELYDLTRDPVAGAWVLAYDQNRSLYPIEDPVVGVLSSDGIVLIDGHHSALASIYCGALTLPIELIADWSDKSRERFWADALERNWVFLKKQRRKRRALGPDLRPAER